ncbi:MAG TPA: zf-HC2 domain-containing protein, partial [Geothrix sp.]|nr:zf-HC2 domain-containing protein [Geothrix sp.]
MTIHVLDQLPLWVEGDLATAEMAAVDRHLGDCPACRAAADRLRTSQAWLREALAPPFDAGDHESLRHRVMDQIRAERRPSERRLRTRPALLAACAAILLVATLTWRQERPAPGPPAPMAALKSNPEPAPEAPSLARAEPARIAPRSARPPMAVAPADTPPEAPARIEFQTAAHHPHHLAGPGQAPSRSESAHPGGTMNALLALTLAALLAPALPAQTPPTAPAP